MSEEEIKDKYQNSLNDIIHNCKGFPCENDSFYNMQELVDKSYLEYLKLQQENKELKERIDEVVEYIKFIVIHKDAFNEQSDAFGFVKLSQTIWGEELLETLEGDK